jgi:capsular exopolysaccharide synthesis family protein
MTDVEQEFGVPVLGVVPHVDGKPTMVALAAACAGDGLHTVGESFAHIRTALNAWASVQHPASCVLVVTAPDANAGKTVTSCNLAIALAQAGRRTLLVDGDSRRPALHRVFPVSRDKPSLIDVLSAGTEASFKDSAQKTEVANLDVVIFGKHDKTAKATRLLGGDNLKRFIAWATGQYHYVLFDSPPAGIFSDAVVMGAAADGVLLVCRCDRTRKMMMRQISKRLADSGLRAAGIVINDLRESRLRSRLGYGGYYGYYYDHYRYYDDYTRTERKKETGKE